MVGQSLYDGKRKRQNPAVSICVEESSLTIINPGRKLSCRILDTTNLADFAYDSDNLTTMRWQHRRVDKGSWLLHSGRTVDRDRMDKMARCWDRRDLLSAKKSSGVAMVARQLSDKHIDKDDE